MKMPKKVKYLIILLLYHTKKGEIKMNEMYPNRDDYRNNREDYRDNYRYDYRDDYRDDYRRDYDRRGGRMNNRNYRNYRNYREDYHEELEMVMEDMHEGYRKLEDIAEMATDMQDKNMLMKIAEKEKENYKYIKQIVEK